MFGIFLNSMGVNTLTIVICQIKKQSGNSKGRIYTYPAFDAVFPELPNKEVVHVYKTALIAASK